MTDEETSRVVAEDVKCQLAPKRAPPKQYIAPKTIKHFVNMLERPKPDNLPSDYNRSIINSHKAQRSRSSSASGKTIPQLGEQKNQSLPPLNVFSDNDPEVARLLAQTAGHLGMTVAQVDFPMAELAYRYQYGKPLVRPEQVPHLQTQMRRLHEWYMQASKEGNNMLMAAIREEHYFRGNDELHIEFEELFQLFNQDALDKSLVSCYCL